MLLEYNSSTYLGGPDHSFLRGSYVPGRTDLRISRPAWAPQQEGCSLKRADSLKDVLRTTLGLSRSLVVSSVWSYRAGIWLQALNCKPGLHAMSVAGAQCPHHEQLFPRFRLSGVALSLLTYTFLLRGAEWPHSVRRTTYDWQDLVLGLLVAGLSRGQLRRRKSPS